MKFYKLSGIGYPVKIHKFYILLFALCFYNIAYGQNQPITVSMKNQPLLKVFEIIEDQTESRRKIGKHIPKTHTQRDNAVNQGDNGI